MGDTPLRCRRLYLRLRSSTCAIVHFNRITLYRQRKRYGIRPRLLRGQILSHRRWAGSCRRDWSAKVEPVPYSKLDNPQSLNLYSYVYNNPLRTADPDGHCPACIEEAKKKSWKRLSLTSKKAQRKSGEWGAQSLGRQSRAGLHRLGIGVGVFSDSVQPAQSRATTSLPNLQSDYAGCIAEAPRLPNAVSKWGA